MAALFQHIRGVARLALAGALLAVACAAPAHGAAAGATFPSTALPAAAAAAAAAASAPASGPGVPVAPPKAAASSAREAGESAEGEHTVRSVLAVVSAAFALASLAMLMQALWNAGRESYEFRRHWGGFGGSRTGWAFSRPLVEIFVALAMGLFSALLGMSLLNAWPRPSSGTASKADTSQAGVPSPPASSRR